MKMPAWGYVIGILMILVGGCSTLSNIQTLAMPKMMEFQKDMMKSMSKSFEKSSNDFQSNTADSLAIEYNEPNPDEVFNNMADVMDKMTYISEDTEKWMQRSAIAGIIIAFLYILAGAFLLARKHFSLKLAYSILTLSLLFCILRLVWLPLSSMGFMAFNMGISNIFGIVVDLVILIVLISMNKTSYNNFPVKN